MNLVEQLLKIDKGEIEVPKTVKKMYCKKLKQTLEFECFAVDAEKAAEIQSNSIEISNSEISEMKLFELKVFTLIAGCKDLKSKELKEHFGAPTPIELIKTILTSGEIDELYETINDLSAYKEVEESDIKN
ncbi:phage portal protein (plasmid) [Paraclostridium ghonii]|uniref:phage tail assembly chaperone n=1 Tax=Paraclostridium ghonii TaxID=29358 RepID=UPI00202CE5DE|nr:XkdN-like protein [Paeniclostridium ghonii]MCM0168196.1 XkdN-like protein [Paeniclostridium ghonii]